MLVRLKTRRGCKVARHVGVFDERVVCQRDARQTKLQTKLTHRTCWVEHASSTPQSFEASHAHTTKHCRRLSSGYSVDGWYTHSFVVRRAG